LISAGCDLGIASAKAVILEDGRILAAEVLPYKSLPGAAAAEVMAKAIARAGLPEGEMVSCFATGFGAKAVPGADEAVAHATCLRRAVRELNQRVRTVIDVGGHSLTAFNVKDSGRMGTIAVTDMCAAGTGKFIEAMARVLEMQVDELGEITPRSTRPLRVTGQCVVLAESDVISHINDGAEPRDIVAGILSSVADKIAGVVRRIDVNEDVALVGGVAKNSTVVRHLERELGLKMAELAGIDPQIVGAFGAAILAREAQAGPLS
jgi:predicted CoA-substrate-specific enzyme activase